jgi:hypothetical protein
VIPKDGPLTATRNNGKRPVGVNLLGERMKGWGAEEGNQREKNKKKGRKKREKLLFGEQISLERKRSSKYNYR